jgi:hypothetical protein
LWSFEGSAPPSLVQRGITGATFEPGNTVTFMYCPLRDGRPGGAIGWARLDDGQYINPADGGCSGNEKTVTRCNDWLAMGYTSKAEAEKAQSSALTGHGRRRVQGRRLLPRRSAHWFTNARIGSAITDAAGPLHQCERNP